MCLSEVGRVVEIDDRGAAVVDVDGRRRRVSLAALVLDPDVPPVVPGHWVLLHTGFAVEVLSEPEARELGALARAVRSTGTESTGTETTGGRP